MQVLTYIAGSYLVVKISDDFEHYIEARKDLRYPNFSFIEVVKGGQVLCRSVIHNSRAAEKIVQLIAEQNPLRK